MKTIRVDPLSAIPARLPADAKRTAVTAATKKYEITDKSSSQWGELLPHSCAR